eukprot:CAMPEP_0117762472 /NCGR_PEP_ID=MMETSP0947-20121206/17957_1 /TAXON_ID=44440 /ORGANISM="Chattonella subsalsa, Strain CCMP2191" /LENGTH=139 /DNA_ID=CAMNT_0005583783 /DNA_START=23 /DNA_END=439 /DNA_ORIENTATION=-
MDKESPIVEATPANDIETGSGSEVPIAIPLLQPEHINTFVIGNPTPTEQERQPTEIIKQLGPLVCLLVVGGLALDIAALVVGSSYSGDVPLCNKWARYLEIAAYAAIAGFVLIVLLLFQAVMLATSGEGISNFASFRLC